MLIRLMNISELPEELIATAKVEPRESIATLKIDFSDRKFFGLFKKIKDFRGRLPTSYLGINDFKVYFFSIKMSIADLIQLSKLVYKIFHKKGDPSKEGTH